MENFNYHRPAKPADAVNADEEGEGRQVPVGRHDADPDDEAGARHALATSSISAA